MKIGVISDTHDVLPGEVVDALRYMDEIWHLGDVCQPQLLYPLESLEVPLHIVAGNCDFESNWPETLSLQRLGRVFFLVHIPLHQPPEGVDVLLHGHTHLPRDEMVSNCRFINPGAVAGADKGAPHGFGVITLHQGEMGWRQYFL